MNPRMSQALDRAKNLASGFTPGQRGIIVVAALALILGSVALTQWVAQPTWTPLFSSLSGSDANAIVEQLRSQNVQYQLTDGGTTILVPQAQVDGLRISLAGQGLPGNESGSGWSILDKQGLTATDFQQNIAYQRALQDELNQTLEAMSGVKTASVTLAIPKKDVFATEQDKTTAAVLLQLTPGTTLDRGQVRSITHLVAGSVPGLDPSEVTVTDQNGSLLSTREDGTAGAAGAANETDQQTALFEDRMNAKLQAMLDKVYGPGKSVVRVTAELNFDTQESTSQNYSASPSVPPLSVAQTSESYNNGAAAAGGVLGVVTPTPVASGAGNGAYNKSELTQNNALDSTVTKTVAAPGSVKRMSVAVVIDEAAKADPAKVEALLTPAAGLDTQGRGDTIKVDSLPFDTAATEATKKELAAQAQAAQLAQYIDLGKKAGLGLLALIAGILFLRKRKKDDATIAASASDLPEGLLVPPPRVEAIGMDRLAAIGASPEGDAEEEKPRVNPALQREKLRDEVAEYVDSQPDDIAQLVQSWLTQQS